MTSHLGSAISVVRDPVEAFERALADTAPEDVIFISGSLYLVGDLRRHWATRTAARVLW
jgi:folylpolyglutamate synthase/dihydropteroate synthase